MDLRDEHGFTIQELMVVMVVGALLTSFGVSLFLFGQKLFISWERKSALQTAVIQLLDNIASDVLQSNYISQISDTGLVIRKKSGKNVRYSFDGSIVKRNDGALFVGQGINLKVSLSPARNTSRYAPLLGVNVTGKSSTHTYSVTVQVTVPRSSQVEFMNGLP